MSTNVWKRSPCRRRYSPTTCVNCQVSSARVKGLVHAEGGRGLCDHKRAPPLRDVRQGVSLRCLGFPATIAPGQHAIGVARVLDLKAAITPAGDDAEPLRPLVAHREVREATIARQAHGPEDRG